MAHFRVEPFVDENPGEVPVRGYLHHAVTPSSDALVLTHGASGNCNAVLLIALAEEFSASGLNVLCCDLPFRQLRAHGPPSPAGAKRDQAGIRKAIMLMRQQFSGRVYVGGQSYGGRQASILVASEPQMVEGLLLLSYPLHPPGRPTQLRTTHFANLNTPALFISGTKDTFGSVEELQSAIKLISAPTRLVQVGGAGHSLLTKTNREELPKMIIEAFDGMFRPNGPEEQ
ncbi:MAG: alpha/beta family hydrolase [Candidatus Korobacteraceae bacterium]